MIKLVLECYEEGKRQRGEYNTQHTREKRYRKLSTQGHSVMFGLQLSIEEDPML